MDGQRFLNNLMLAACLFVIAAVMPTHADPNDDRRQLTTQYQRLFPDLQLSDYANGVYSIDKEARESWQAIEEFPPYESAIERGEKAFKTPFKRTGRTYGNCFPKQGIGIANRYPLWDKTNREVVTLVSALNACRVKNLESPLNSEKGEIADLLAYMAYTSRGKPMTIVVPQDDPRALAAYEQGKYFYYQRHGQLNFACTTCHIQNAGKRLRSELLSPALGHTVNWPTYRLKWGEMGTLHRRFRECLTQIKAEPPLSQSEILRNLEYFLTYMGNGIPFSGPSTRK